MTTTVNDYHGVGMPLFVAGAVFGEVAVSPFVARAGLCQRVHWVKTRGRGGVLAHCHFPWQAQHFLPCHFSWRAHDFVMLLCFPGYRFGTTKLKFWGFHVRFVWQVQDLVRFVCVVWLCFVMQRRAGRRSLLLRFAMQGCAALRSLMVFYDPGSRWSA